VPRLSEIARLFLDAEVTDLHPPGPAEEADEAKVVR
jgi:hypothetical protein